jgi:hypothetical protein
MNDDAKEVTTYFVVGAEGKVWSETRLNRREVMTRTSVATFSGASSSARRTVSDSRHDVFVYQRWHSTVEKSLVELTVLW